ITKGEQDMKTGRISCAAVAMLLSVAVASCTQTEGSGGSVGFQSQYDTARGALEAGDYRKATRLYKQLVPKAGPLGVRVRLEYSHAVLRAGDYAGAAEMSDSVASDAEGGARAAALAVRGTAEHEMALQYLGTGDAEAGAAHLAKARAALREVLDAHPDMDPLGSLAGRVAAIDARLAAME
ncbi:hypothetical protein N9W17_06290, partial [Jannaschia sp.]|nr:hypothetical protein [Jannaschia sp.]